MAGGIELKTVDDRQEWSRHFPTCRLTELMQTWEYGEGVKKTIGWEPVRHLVLKGGLPVAMAQTVSRELPVLGRVARIQHGPMFLEHEGRFDPAAAFDAIQALRRYWVDEKKTALHLTPCLFPGDLPEGWAGKAGLNPSGETLWATVRMDLSKDPEILHKNLKRSWKHPLNRARRNGLEYEVVASDPEFDRFLEKYREAIVRKGISWPSAELVQNIWPESRSSMEIHHSLKDGERIASIVTMAYASTVYAFVAWNGPLSGKYNASNHLIWQILLRAREQGFLWFDLGGTDPVALPGITKFKRGLQGEEYTLVGNFEARPTGSLAKITDGEEGESMGHILPGLRLPAAPAREEESDGVKARVQALLAEFVMETLNMAAEMDPETSLIEGGLIDSLSLVSLIQALQDAFDIQIQPQDITVENFDRIRDISDFVESRIAK